MAWTIEEKRNKYYSLPWNAYSHSAMPSLLSRLTVPDVEFLWSAAENTQREYGNWGVTMVMLTDYLIYVNFCKVYITTIPNFLKTEVFFNIHCMKSSLHFVILSSTLSFKERSTDMTNGTYWRFPDDKNKTFEHEITNKRSSHDLFLTTNCNLCYCVCWTTRKE